MLFLLHQVMFVIFVKKLLLSFIRIQNIERLINIVPISFDVTMYNFQECLLPRDLAMLEVMAFAPGKRAQFIFQIKSLQTSKWGNKMKIVKFQNYNQLLRKQKQNKKFISTKLHSTGSQTSTWKKTLIITRLQSTGSQTSKRFK